MTPAHTTADTTAPATDQDLTGLAPLHPVLPHVVVYSQPICPDCDRLKMLLALRKTPAATVDITSTPEALEMFTEHMGIRTTPIALVHNLYTEPVYFTGASVEHLRIITAAITERMTALTATGLFTGDHDQAGLAADLKAAAQGERIADAATFAQRTAALAPHTGHLAARADRPAALSTKTDQRPELLN